VLEKRRLLLGAICLLLLLFFVRRGPLWPGAVVALLGEGLQLWAAGNLHKNIRLAASGPYRHLRNPMYLGRFLLGFGFLLFTHSWPVLLGYVLIFSFYAHTRVLREEARLRQIFGSEYADYCRLVPRWLPRLRPAPAPAASGFRWATAVLNHEHRVATGVVITLLAFFLRVYLLGSRF